MSVCLSVSVNVYFPLTDDDEDLVFAHTLQERLAKEEDGQAFALLLDGLIRLLAVPAMFKKANIIFIRYYTLSIH